MINITEVLQEHCRVINSLDDLGSQIISVADRMVECIRRQGKILWFGNGGSAADSQHLAAELVGRFEQERIALPSIALTTDTSILTAIANDYGFESVFVRQIQALCQPSDLVIGISTSGNSDNVLNAISKAKEIGAYTIGFSGYDGGKLVELADTCIIVPSNNTARIQEAHILIGHILCSWVEKELIHEH